MTAVPAPALAAMPATALCQCRAPASGRWARRPSGPQSAPHPDERRRRRRTRRSRRSGPGDLLAPHRPLRSASRAAPCGVATGAGSGRARQCVAVPAAPGVTLGAGDLRPGSGGLRTHVLARTSPGRTPNLCSESSHPAGHEHPAARARISARHIGPRSRARRAARAAGRFRLAARGPDRSNCSAMCASSGLGGVWLR